MSTSLPTASKSSGTSRRASASVTDPSTEPETSPRNSCATFVVTLPPPYVEICSSEVSASRMPPRACLVMSSSAASSYEKPSCEHTKARCACISSAPMAWKSKRWTRERTVARIFCGSVVHMMKTTWAGGSSMVLSSALNAAGVSMWTSSMM